MKLNPEEIKSVQDEYPKPDLAEVTPRLEEQVEPISQQRAETATAAPTANAAVQEQVEASGDDTVGAIDNLMKQQSESNAALIVALDKLNKGTLQVQTTLDRMYQLMHDERYAPQVDVWKRKASPDNTSKEAEPGDGKSGEGLLDGIFGSALGGIAGLLAGKSLLGSVFGRGRNTPNTAPGTVQPRSRIGGWIDRMRGTTPTPHTTVPQSSTAPRPPNSPNTPNVPSTPNTPNSPNTSTTRAMPKGGRLGLLAAGGAAAYAGYDWLSNSYSNFVDSAKETSTVTIEELDMQAARVNQGLPKLEDDDLVAYRKSITERNGMIANTKTGTSLSAVQSTAVRAKVLTPEQASEMTNDEVYKVLEAEGVSTNYAPTKGIGDTGGGAMSYADDLAVAGVGIYAAKKAGDMLGNSSATTASPAPAAPATPVTSSTAAPRPPTSVARAPFVDNTPRQALPSNAQLSTIRTNLVSSANSAVAGVEANQPASGGFKKGFGKALPVIGTALTAYDAAQIITDEEATTKQKAGSLADLAGGTAGAILGAKAGAGAGAAAGAAIGAFFFGAGAVPGAAIGAALGGIGGGIAGYMGGSGITKSVREWMFGDDSTEAIAQPGNVATSQVTASSQVANVGDQTEQAFDQIVQASKPQNNSWVSSVTGVGPAAPKVAKSHPVGIGVMKPQTVAQPTAVNPTATAANAAQPNVSSASQPNSVASVSNFSATAQNPIPAVREQYQPIKETYVVNPPPAERKQATEVAKDKLAANRSNSNTNTAVTRMDDIPTVLNEAGIGLINSGYS